MTTQTEALKMALKNLKWIDNWIYEKPAPECIARLRKAVDSIKEVLAQPEQKPFGYFFEVFCLPECASKHDWVESFSKYKPTLSKDIRNITPLYTIPPQRKPQFKEFIKWAGAQGYDCAQTCNSDTGEWIVLNPMTADLWKAWQAAHGIKE